MKKINYLVGNSNFCHSPFKPFSEEVCDFLVSLSKEINFYKEIKNYPDLKALAFWCRAQSIQKLKKNFNHENNRLGLGIIFHVTPSNIPTNFAYSLIFGLITGNSNIVKVPSKEFDQVKIICNLIKKILSKKKNFLKKKITIIQYKENNEFTKKFSLISNARIIWGGNETINNLRDFRINERALDITFADRYSFCIINQSKLEKISNFEFKNFIQRFYNDTYAVDQNACSSPHLVIWHGKNSSKIRDKFWAKLYDLVKKKYEFSDSAHIEKYADLCKYAANLKHIKKIKTYENLIYRIELNKLDINNHNNRGKQGLFFEHNIKDLNKINHIINNKYQTLTYFGINKDILKQFVLKNNLKGIDRIVPVGQSLDISLLWDGYDILNILSRGIDVR